MTVTPAWDRLCMVIGLIQLVPSFFLIYSAIITYHFLNENRVFWCRSGIEILDKNVDNVESVDKVGEKEDYVPVKVEES